MRKFYTLLAFGMLMTLMATAQFEKGQKLWGGNVGFSVTQTDNNYSSNQIVNNQTSISINPQFARFSNQIY